MITPDYCLQMARYNAWQNREMATTLAALGPAGRDLDRGAFFGSIQATANHLLWGDLTWLSRFDGGEGPSKTLSDSTQSAVDFADWKAQRVALDQRFLTWARDVKQPALEGTFSWHSVAMQRDFSQPMAVCIMQMFNHQTHHRGQIHAMVTAAGARGWTTDLPFMPAEFSEH